MCLISNAKTKRSSFTGKFSDKSSQNVVFFFLPFILAMKGRFLFEKKLSFSPGETSPTPSPLSRIQANIHSQKGNLSSRFRCDAIFFPPVLCSLNSPSAAIKVCLIGLIVLGLPAYICQAKLCGLPLGPAQLLSNFEGREIDGMKHRWSGQLDGSENETHYRHL